MIIKTDHSHFRTRIIYLFTTIFLVALSFFIYFQIVSLINTFKQVNHTNNVNYSLKIIAKAIVDAGSNQKSYLLTGESAMLTKRDHDFNIIRNELNKVDSLTKNNAEQNKNVGILRILIKDNLSHFNKMSATYQPLQLAPAFKLSVNNSFYKTEKLIQEINKMSSLEYSLLELQSKKYQRLAFSTPLINIFLSLGALFILFISYFRILSTLDLSQQLQTRLEESNKELEKKNKELIVGAELFLKIFDNSPIAMSFGEIETNQVVYANTLFYDSFGYSAEEVIGYTPEELNLTSEEENERLYPIILGHLEENRSIEELKALTAEERAILLLTLKEKMLKNGFEILYTRKNGETFFAIVFVEVIDIGNKKYSLTTYQDITERKEAQSQLANEKAFAEMVIENDPSMIVVYDENLQIISWNKKSEEFSGYKKEEVLGKSTFNVFPEYNQEPWLSTFNSVLKEGKSLHFPIVEIEHKKKFIESWLMPLQNTNKQIIGVLGITRDITEITETNKELEKKNAELIEGGERYLKIFDNNPVAMVFAEIGNNHIIYANNLFYKQFGYSREEVLGHTIDELNLVSPQEKERLQTVLMAGIQEYRTIEELQKLSEEETIEILLKLRGKMFENGFEVKYTRKNGTTFFAIVFYEVIEIGNKKFVLSSYQDISDIKKVSQQLEEKNITLAKINKELESVNYISSHDLQEPLRQIQVFASRISDNEKQYLSEDGKTYFDKINNAAKRMQNLIADLLAYSRTKTEARQFKTINLNQIINQVVEEFAEIIDEKQAIIDVDQLGDAYVIPFQFRQMIYNLIGNSLKFAKPDLPPHITIKNELVKSPQVPGADPKTEIEYYHFSIKDNGIGFESQYNSRIFEVFQRLHNKQKIAGTGIGLSIVKNIVENHNGIIKATAELNVGATFDIYIPTIQNN